jgi:hypothetical protein
MNKTLHKVYIASFFLAGIGLAILIAIDGYSYYITSLEERFFHENHTALKPSGIYGHAYGIAGSLMLIFGVTIYMVRKRVRRFFNIGYLKHWLEFHIFLCTTGPMLILYHTSFKFGGIVAVSFWSMVAVVLSGVAGRFIYIQIPRNIQGKEIDVKQLEEESEKMVSEIKNSYNLSSALYSRIEDYSSPERYRGAGLGMSILFVLQDYFKIQSFTSAFGKELRSAEVPSRARKELLRKMKKQMVLTRRIGQLRTMQKLFRYWHIIHLPFAITMFVIMFIHIAVTIIFGYRWIL